MLFALFFKEYNCRDLTVPTISLTVDAIKSTESHAGLIKEMSTKGTKSTKKWMAW